jgi:hypothetical protein
VLPINLNVRLVYRMPQLFVETAYLLSMPSKPEASTKPLADLPKLSRDTALAATTAKLSLAPPPPMLNTNLRYLYCSFNLIKEPKHPIAPSTGICASAHSSLNSLGQLEEPKNVGLSHKNSTISVNMSKCIENVVYTTVIQRCRCLSSIDPIIRVVYRILPCDVRYWSNRGWLRSSGLRSCRERDLRRYWAMKSGHDT